MVLLEDGVGSGVVLASIITSALAIFHGLIRRGALALLFRSFMFIIYLLYLLKF